MCSPEFNLTGVLVANKNKAGTKACTIPAACHGKIVQTSFLDHAKFFGYLVKVSVAFFELSSPFECCICPYLYNQSILTNSQARWAFLPQICDASPRVSTNALSMDIPLLMNRNIMGGWKYLVPGETGEFFHDMNTDFKDSLRRIVDNTRGKNNPYRPLEFVKKNYGNVITGRRFLEFVKQHWGDRVTFPHETTGLIPVFS